MVSPIPSVMVKERDKPEGMAILGFAVTCKPEEEGETAAGALFPHILTAVVVEERKEPAGAFAGTCAVGKEPHKQVNSAVAFLNIALIGEQRQHPGFSVPRPSLGSPQPNKRFAHKEKKSPVCALPIRLAKNKRPKRDQTPLPLSFVLNKRPQNIQPAVLVTNLVMKKRPESDPRLPPLLLLRSGRLTLRKSQ